MERYNYAFCFHGKFYLYDTPWHITKEGLAKAIVSCVPKDPIEYRGWLLYLRDRFQAYEQLFNLDFFAFGDDDRLWYQKVRRRPDFPPPPQFVSALRYGNALIGLPSPIAFGRSVFDQGYIYIIDLDREELKVGSSSYLRSWKLNEMSHVDRCYLSVGNERTGALIDPAADVSDQVSEEEKSSDPDGCELEIRLTGAVVSSRFRLQRITPKQAIDEQEPTRTHQLFRRFMFRSLARNYHNVLVGHVLTCRPHDFIYREFAFAIVSLAAGHFSLLQGEHDGFREVASSMGLSINVSDRTQTFLPAFGFEIHKRDVEPGSAPTTNIYWFQDVLISLDDGLRSTDGFKAAVTRVIRFARDTGRRSFHGLIFSLLEVVLLRVLPTGVVEFTDRLPLFNSALLNADWNNQRLRCEGFVAMTYLFDAALLPSQQPNAGSFSDEIYHRIMDYTDWTTYRTCAKVSRSFAGYAKSRVRLGDRIVARAEPFRLHDCLGLKIFDQMKQPKSRWVVLPVQQDISWSPRMVRRGYGIQDPRCHLVIGDGDRLSLLASLFMLIDRKNIMKTVATGRPTNP